jgi:membrane protein
VEAAAGRHQSDGPARADVRHRAAAGAVRGTHRFDTVWMALQVAFPPLFMLLVFAIIYRYAPNVRSQNWEALIPGAMVGVGVWLAATWLFRLYLQFFNTYSNTYGSLGTVIVLMLWLYISGAAILVGGEVNSEIRKAAARAGAPQARAPIQAGE